MHAQPRPLKAMQGPLALAGCRRALTVWELEPGLSAGWACEPAQPHWSKTGPVLVPLGSRVLVFLMMALAGTPGGRVGVSQWEVASQRGGLDVGASCAVKRDSSSAGSGRAFPPSAAPGRLSSSLRKTGSYLAWSGRHLEPRACTKQARSWVKPRSARWSRGSSGVGFWGRVADLT